MEAYQRLNELYSYLLYSKLVDSQADFAKKVKYGETSMSKAMKGNPKYCTASLLKKVGTRYQNIVNLEWLLDGTGEMIKPSYPGRPNIVVANMSRTESSQMQTTVDGPINYMPTVAPPHEMTKEDLAEALDNTMDYRDRLQKAYEDTKDELGKAYLRIAQLEAENESHKNMVEMLTEQIQHLRDQNNKMSEKLLTLL